MRRRLLLAASLLALSYIAVVTVDWPSSNQGIEIAEAQAFPNVTQQTLIGIAPVAGATSYEITAQTGAGESLGPWVDKGDVAQLPVSDWLSGQPLDADYQLFARPKNIDEVGPGSAPLNVRLVGSLTQTVLTILP